MADLPKHPYVSGSGGLSQTVAQLRKTFPAAVSADTLKKLAIAPNNETYIINILRFIRVIDDEGKRTPEAAPVFSQHEDEDFQKALAGLVKTAYDGLFSLHGDTAWTLPTEKLISFFRGNDHTGDVVGRRQATTFRTLAALAGHAELPSTKTPKPPTSPRRDEKKVKAAASQTAKPVAVTPVTSPDQKPPKTESGVGLTVRIEINLPVAEDQATYDRIFKSIRENLLRGN